MVITPTSRPLMPASPVMGADDVLRPQAISRPPP